MSHHKVKAYIILATFYLSKVTRSLVNIYGYPAQILQISLEECLQYYFTVYFSAVYHNTQQILNFYICIFVKLLYYHY